MKNSVYTDDGDVRNTANAIASVQASDNSAIMFYNPGPEVDSPGALDNTKTPNQSLFPVSRQESERNQVDPVLLANRLADIPSISNSILTPARFISGLNSAVESPPYGAAQMQQMTSNNLF